MFDDNILKRHRLSGLANGVLVGLGICTLPYGLVIIAVGVAIELWQRSRIPKA